MDQQARVLAELTGPGGEFELSEETVRGISMRVYAHGPRTLRDVLSASAGYGRRTYLVHDGYRCDFAEHYRQAAGLASYLVEECGLRKGDRVAIAMRNYPEWAVVFWAIQAAGLVAVPLNAWWSAAELTFGMTDSGARLVFADAERAALFDGDIAIIEVRGGRSRNNVRAFEQVLGELPASPRLPGVVVNPDDDATIMYTSGTTGRPKGAVATHRNHCTNMLNTAVARRVEQALLNGGELPVADGQDRQLGLLVTFPLFHIAGLTSLYTTALSGMKLGTLYKWDPVDADTLITTAGLTSAAGVPTVMRSLVEHGVGANQLDGINMGGAPIPPDLVRRIGDPTATTASPASGYGLTETTSAVTQLGGEGYLANPDSVGSCVPGTDVRVVDPTSGAELSDGHVGELCFRGPNVVRGYWNTPVATAEAFRDGWFHTGDLGYVRAGLVYVVDRIKDVVLRGGENVYCAEVEAVLHEHADVVDVAVLGLPHSSLGEEVLAIVTPTRAMSAAELRAHVRTRLALFKVPERIVFSDRELPRTAMGKVLKRRLRDRLVGRADGEVLVDQEDGGAGEQHRAEAAEG